MRICIVYTYSYIPTKDELKRNQMDLVIRATADLAKHIPPGSKVLAFGRAMYCVTYDTAILPLAFYDATFNKTSFYSPKLRSWVYPCSSISHIVEEQPGIDYIAHFRDNFDSHFMLQQIDRALKSDCGAVRVPSLNLEEPDDPNEFLRQHMEPKKVAWDFETTGLDRFTSDVICITLSFDGRTGYYLPWKKVDQQLLDEFFSNKFTIGANLKFDTKFLKQLGFRHAHINYDTTQAGHTLHELRSNSLKSHAYYYTYYGGYDWPLEEYKRKYNIENYGDIPENILKPYATMDAIITYQVYEAMEAQLKQDPLLYEYFHKYRLPIYRTFTNMEHEGIHVDWDRASEVYEELHSKITYYRDLIYQEFGCEVDLDSRPVMGKFIMNELGWPVIEWDKSGKFPLTKSEHLKDWAKMGYKAAEYLIEYRKWFSYLNTFVGEDEQLTVSGALDDFVKPSKKKKSLGARQESYGIWKYRAPNGRVYPEYATMLAHSHRHRSYNPNMQNNPKNAEGAEHIRSIFAPPSSDYYMLAVDYDGLQLRVGAVYSDDDVMRDEFINSDGDLHSVTAQAIFARDMTVAEFKSHLKEMKYKNMRRSSKFINFLLEFGGGAYSLGHTYIEKEWTKEECLEYIRTNGCEKKMSKSGAVDIYWTVAIDIRNKFFERYSGLGKWIENGKEDAHVNGYVRSLFGARRLLPELTYTGSASDGAVISNLENIALNSPVQNFETIVVGMAMVRFEEFANDHNLKSRLFVNIHDEIGYYIHKDEMWVLPEIRRIMEAPWPEAKGIPFTVEFNLANPHHPAEPTYWGFGKTLSVEEIESYRRS